MEQTVHLRENYCIFLGTVCICEHCNFSPSACTLRAQTYATYTYGHIHTIWAQSYKKKMNYANFSMKKMSEKDKNPHSPISSISHSWAIFSSHPSAILGRSSLLIHRPSLGDLLFLCIDQAWALFSSHASTKLGRYKKKALCPRVFSFVPRAGVEPARIAPLVFETSASTDSAIWASHLENSFRALFVRCERREGDSNPRYGYPYDSLANCWFQPLPHLSSQLRTFTFL